MPETRARTAGPGDINALIALEPLAANDANRQRFLRRSVNANECYIVERDGVLVAFGVLNYSFFDHGFIAAITVSESIRLPETVIPLVRYMESRCRTAKLFATACADNLPLQTILRRIQYVDCGSVSNIAETDESDLLS